MRTTLIFNVQHFTLNDGPGIRTTCFFKGCNLRCVWCHNPESFIDSSSLLYFQDRCIGCGNCTSICPQKVHDMSPERGHILDRKKCTACGICAEHCPSNALEITGRVIEDDELVEKLSRDRLLYESSGGGVTFSGGEVLLHIDKLIRIAGRIREKGIHIAVDSAANVPWESIERSFPVIDLYLFDVKLLDPKKHQEYTGVNNKLILDNIKRTALVKPMYIRVPVIRGINDNDEEMCKIADYALSLGPNLKKLEFLTYHDLGKRKYTALGMEWRAFSAPVLDRMNQFKAFFEQKGILVSVS